MPFPAPDPCARAARDRAPPHRHGLAAVLLVTGLVWALPAHAVSTFTAVVDSGTGGAADSDESDTGDATAFAEKNRVDDSRYAGTAAAYAIAGPSGLGGMATAALGAAEPEDDAIGLLGSAAASARWILQDLVFQADGGQTEVEVATNILVSGAFAIARDAAYDGDGRGSVLVSYGLGQTGPGGGATPQTIGIVVREETRDTVNHGNSGIFAGLDDRYAFDALFQTPTRLVPVGVPLRLTLELIASVSISSRDGAAIDVAADFRNTLTFDPRGPVFALPDGATANSASARIVDNRWVGASAQVPLPPAALALVAGLAALAGLRRR